MTNQKVLSVTQKNKANFAIVNHHLNNRNIEIFFETDKNVT